MLAFIREVLWDGGGREWQSPSHLAAGEGAEAEGCWGVGGDRHCVGVWGDVKLLGSSWKVSSAMMSSSSKWTMGEAMMSCV